MKNVLGSFTYFVQHWHSCIYISSKRYFLIFLFQETRGKCLPPLMEISTPCKFSENWVRIRVVVYRKYLSNIILFLISKVYLWLSSMWKVQQNCNYTIRSNKVKEIVQNYQSFPNWGEIEYIISRYNDKILYLLQLILIMMKLQLRLTIKQITLVSETPRNNKKNFLNWCE